MLENPSELGCEKTYLGNGCSEYHNLIELADAFHELVHSWSLDHIDVVVVALDFNGYCEVSLVQDLGTSVSLHPSKTETHYRP